MSFPLLPVNQKSNPWNWTPETLNKTCTPWFSWSQLVDQCGPMCCYQRGNRVSSSRGSLSKPCSSTYPHILTWPLPLFGVLFAASDSRSPFSELLYLKNYTVAKGFGGNWWNIFNLFCFKKKFCFVLFFFILFQPFFYLILLPTSLPWSPVEHCLLLYYSKVLFDPWMSFFPPFHHFIVLYSGPTAEPFV